tara:strand:- start:136 stop:1074 length:939 start_codon:yes stop_codon:yes gene_type:complete
MIHVLGGYDRFLYVIYDRTDPNEDVIATLRELGVTLEDSTGPSTELVTAIDQIYETRGCLNGISVFGDPSGKSSWSFCNQPWDDYGDRHPCGLFWGWGHEYFHHYQRAHRHDKSGSMPGEGTAIGFEGRTSEPAWSGEGSANLFATLVSKEIFNDLTWAQENNLRAEEIANTSNECGRYLFLDFDRTFQNVKRGAMGVPGFEEVDGGFCLGMGPGEEYRNTSNCDADNWLIVTAYLAYITSYQTVFVDLYEDMWALNFDGSFQKHVGMTKEQFYDSYNEFIRSGDPDDPPPSDFFPTEPLSELVDFWSIQSG